jgi:hypothetical protein
MCDFVTRQKKLAALKFLFEKYTFGYCSVQQFAEYKK